MRLPKRNVKGTSQRFKYVVSGKLKCLSGFGIRWLINHECWACFVAENNETCGWAS